MLVNSTILNSLVIAILVSDVDGVDQAGQSIAMLGEAQEEHVCLVHALSLIDWCGCGFGGWESTA